MSRKTNQMMRLHEADVATHRATPERGHTILLMEPNPGEKTFADYPDLVTCLDKITAIYEQFRVSINLPKEDFELSHLWKWMDDLHRIELLVFDSEISRYKRVAREELKQTFVDQISKMSPPSSQTTNGKEPENPTRSSFPLTSVSTKVTYKPPATNGAVNNPVAGSIDERCHPHTEMGEEELDYGDDEDDDNEVW